jgi:hypothetical protein
MSKCIYQLWVALFFFIGLSIFSFVLPLRAPAGSIPEASSPAIDCEGTIEAWVSSGYYRPNDCKCINGQPVCGKSSSGGSVSGNSQDINQEIKMQIVGTIFQSLLTSIFSNDESNKKAALAAKQKAEALAAQQNAALQREKAREAQAAYVKMMRSYKQLDDSQGVAFKTLSDSSMGFKTLDEDSETLEANARKPFDTASEKTDSLSGTVTAGGATPFFGDTMPTKDIRLLVNPESDPNVIDLRNAVAYVAKNIKSSTDPEHAKGAPILRGPSCRELDKRLMSFINDRMKFQKTINLAQEQLNVWETANRDALLSAAKDGLEYFTGQLFELIARRAKAAAILERIYKKNARQMVKEGLDVTEIQAKIRRLKALSSLNLISDLKDKMDEIDAWQHFLKDGVSALINQLTASNQEIQEMLDDPSMQQYFERESPELETLLDISKIAASYKVLGKWVAKKLSIIGSVELSINLLYDGTAYLVSFHRLSEADKINGHVMDTARYIQKNIDDTSQELSICQ